MHFVYFSKHCYDVPLISTEILDAAAIFENPHCGMNKANIFKIRFHKPKENRQIMCLRYRLSAEISCVYRVLMFHVLLMRAVVKN